MNNQQMLNNLYEISIKLCDIIQKLSVQQELQNEQIYLDWQDNLNEISVR